MKRIHPFAKLLRKRSTDVEHHLWFYLRAHRLNGFKFRRQHPIGRFIVDFCCPEQHLVIELDGGQHLEQQEADRERTRTLEGEGFRILRFWDHEIFQQTDCVLSKILEALPPLPSPSPRR